MAKKKMLNHLLNYVEMQSNPPYTSTSPESLNLLISSSFSHPLNTKCLQRSNMEFENTPMEVAEKLLIPKHHLQKAIPSHHFLKNVSRMLYDYDEKVLGLVMLKAGSGRKRQAKDKTSSSCSCLLSKCRLHLPVGTLASA